MKAKDIKGQKVTLYLDGGRIFTAKVNDVTLIETTDSCGRLVRYEGLVLIVNGHTTIVRFDKVIAFEIY